MKNIIKKGFTLAEVLIVLSIIGIVAEFTIPTLLYKVQMAELQTALKKAYSDISQAFSLAAFDEGLSTADFHNFCSTWNGSDYINSTECINLIYGRLKVLDKEDHAYPNNNYVKNLNGTKIVSGIGNDYVINWRHKRLSNGMIISVWVNSLRVNFDVDVNGYKNPNIIGKDNFAFISTTKGIIPDCQTKAYTEEELKNSSYSWVDGHPCNYASNQEMNGIGCTYYALYDISPEDAKKSYWKDFLK